MEKLDYPIIHIKIYLFYSNIQLELLKKILKRQRIKLNRNCYLFNFFLNDFSKFSSNQNNRNYFIFNYENTY